MRRTAARETGLLLQLQRRRVMWPAHVYPHRRRCRRGRRKEPRVGQVTRRGRRLQDVRGQDGVSARPREGHLLSLVLHPTVLEPNLSGGEKVGQFMIYLKKKICTSIK
jgi:hypothetical protein